MLKMNQPRSICVILIILVAIISSLSTWIILSIKSDPYKSIKKFSERFHKSLSEMIKEPIEVTNYDVSSMPDELKRKIDENPLNCLESASPEKELVDICKQYEIKVMQRRKLSHIYLSNVKRHNRPGYPFKADFVFDLEFDNVSSGIKYAIKLEFEFNELTKNWILIGGKSKMISEKKYTDQKWHNVYGEEWHELTESDMKRWLIYDAYLKVEAQ